MRLDHKRLVAFCLAAFCPLLTGVAFAQSSTGTIGGRVVDTSGGVIAGAEVRIVNQVNQSARIFTTNPSGSFVFPNVDPGDYTVLVKMSGFKQFEKKDLHVAPSDSIALGDLALTIGDVADTVEVKAEIGLVQTASGDRSNLIDSKDITDLMARGRDVMYLLQLMPGTVDDATGSDILGAFNTPTMDGIRSNYNALNIDGLSGNTARGSNAQSPINMDAIKEVKVLTNSYSAEFGTASGGVINLVTKNGTQDFHGGMYYYSRNEDFNADNYFNNAAQPYVPRPRYRYNTEGTNLGGPIFWPHHFNANRQRLFFFFSQEYDPNTSPNSLRTFTVPTALERQGDFSQTLTMKGAKVTVKDPTTGAAFPNNVIPPTRLDPNMVKLMNVFPLPNAQNEAQILGYNFQIAGSEDTPVKQEILRVDYNISDKAHAWFRASGYSSDNTGLTSAANKNTWGLAPIDYQQTMPSLGTDFTYIFSPTLVNEATVGMQLWTEDQLLSSAGLTAYQRSTYGLNIPQSYPADNPQGLLPAVSFGNIGNNNSVSINYDGRFPMVDDATSWQFSDNLSKVWNNHLFKAGVLIERKLYNQYHQAGGNSFPGSYSFSTTSSNPGDTGFGYANALLGNYNTYTEATNRVDYAPVTKVYEWYGQDDWKIARRLTLNLGLRFTYSLPMEPNNSNAGNFVPYLFDPSQAPVLFRPAVVNGAKVTINPLTGATVSSVYSGLLVPNTGNPLNGIATPATAGFPRDMAYANGLLIGPRFGVAWDPFGNGKWAIRLGGGVFYAGLPDAGTLGNLFFNPPAIYTPTQYYGSVATAANGTGLLSPSAFSRDIDPHGKIVTSYHINFEVQRQIASTLVSAAYVASFGRHLGENVELNNVPLGAEFLPQNQNPQTNTPLNDNFFRPYMGYGSIPQQIWEGNSSYHSLQVQAIRRFSRGIQFGVAFTHSKAMDYIEGDSTSSSTVAYYLNRAVWNYGIAGYDRPNILTFHFLWDVPRLSRIAPNRFVKAVFDGWQVSDITSFISGPPMAITMKTSPGVNFTGGGDGNERPLVVANPNLPSSQRSVNQWYNLAAFAEPIPVDPKTCTTSGCPPITWVNFGDASSMPIRGPGTNNWNTSVFKNFTIHERLHFQLRGEAYNTFNHTQFKGVGTTIQYNAAGQNTTVGAGTVTSARDARYLQLALRLMF